MRLDRIVECLFLAPSHFSIGLQCADLVTATTVAAERVSARDAGTCGPRCRGSQRIRPAARSRASA